MGHQISAVVIAGSIDAKRALEFDTKVVPSIAGFTVVALEPEYVDTWAEKLNIHNAVGARPLLNFSVVHHIIQEIARGCSFAIIETDYFGGVGEQSAAVYRDGVEIMAPQTSRSGVINSALRLLGVPRRLG